MTVMITVSEVVFSIVVGILMIMFFAERFIVVCYDICIMMLLDMASSGSVKYR